MALLIAKITHRALPGATWSLLLGLPLPTTAATTLRAVPADVADFATLETTQGSTTTRIYTAATGALLV